MKAKTSRQKQTAKKASQKKRKLRTDHAQKMPVFNEFTNSWGFSGRKWWDGKAQWSFQKIKHGKYFHPLLEYLTGKIQHDYQCSMFQFLGSTHKLRESDVPNKELWRLHQIRQKKLNGEQLSEDEEPYYKVWLMMLAESLKRIEQLGEIVAGAVACGDIALLEHLILIMQSLSKPTDEPAKPKALVVEKAYDEIVLRRKKKLHQKSNPGLKGVALLLGVAREDQNLLKHIRLPSASDVDKEITKNPALKALVPEWSSRLPDGAKKTKRAKKTKDDADTIRKRDRRQIQRVCKQTGRELSKG